MQEKKHHGAFTIPRTIGFLDFAKALCDLGASISLMFDPNTTTMRLSMVYQTVKRPICILHDVLLKVESFIFLANFVIHDCEFYCEVPITIGRLFIATGPALADKEKGKMKFRLKNEETTFSICRSMKQSDEL